MMNKNVQLATAGLLDMFREGNVPEKIAIATNPKFDVPSAGWNPKQQAKFRTIQLIFRILGNNCAFFLITLNKHLVLYNGRVIRWETQT
ncbi:MAG: hypothetical protein V1837_04870 [Candidatus Woesearchaeota archaeon]